jgi:hypothetical protein
MLSVPEVELDEDEGEDSDDAPPPPPMFTDAVLTIRDRRLVRKSMALRPAWWAAGGAELESLPVVPLIPGSRRTSKLVRGATSPPAYAAAEPASVPPTSATATTASLATTSGGLDAAELAVAMTEPPKPLI